MGAYLLGLNSFGVCLVVGFWYLCCCGWVGYFIVLFCLFVDWFTMFTVFCVGCVF